MHSTLELFLDVHLAQPSVFLLQLLHARHQGGVHAAELGTPLVERRRADAQLAAELGDRQAGFRPLERIDDLAVGEARFLHARDSPVRVSTSQCVGFTGGLPQGHSQERQSVHSPSMERYTPTNAR